MNVVSVILTPTIDWKTVHPTLESDTGGWKKFMFHYVATRGSVQQVGEFDINDNGIQVQNDHEWTIVPSGQSINMEFDVSHFNGKRVLRYKTTEGSDNIVFKFVIDHRIA